MSKVTIDEIQRNPLKYLRQVQAGETLIIMCSEQAIAALRPIQSASISSASKTSKKLRPTGLYTGEFVVPKDFDSPLTSNCH